MTPYEHDTNTYVFISLPLLARNTQEQLLTAAIIIMCISQQQEAE